MSKDRVVDYHIGRLQDRRESVRLDAIEQLRLLGAVDALEALEDVYHNDPDEGCAPPGEARQGVNYSD